MQEALNLGLEDFKEKPHGVGILWQNCESFAIFPVTICIWQPQYIANYQIHKGLILVLAIKKRLALSPPAGPISAYHKGGTKCGRHSDNPSTYLSHQLAQLSCQMLMVNPIVRSHLWKLILIVAINQIYFLLLLLQQSKNLCRYSTTSVFDRLFKKSFFETSDLCTFHKKKPKKNIRCTFHFSALVGAYLSPQTQRVDHRRLFGNGFSSKGCEGVAQPSSC